jgi:hypothetical protein
VQTRSDAPLATPEGRERAHVLGDVTTASGGMALPVLSEQSIPGGFERLHRLFQSRLRLTYGRPDRLIPPEKLEVTTRRPDLRVLAPGWAGR